MIFFFFFFVSLALCQQPSSSSSVIGTIETTIPILTGWACRRNTTQSLDLEVYFGSREDGVLITRTKATVARPDLPTGFVRDCRCVQQTSPCLRGFRVQWDGLQPAVRFINQAVVVEVWTVANGAGVNAERVGQATSLSVTAALLGIAPDAPEPSSVSFFAPSTPAETPSFVDANTNFVYAGAAGGGVLVLIVAIVVALRCRKRSRADESSAAADDSTVPRTLMTATDAPPPTKVPDDIAMLEAWKAEALAKRDLPLAPGQKPKIVFDEDDPPMPAPYETAPPGGGYEAAPTLTTTMF
jgi:hypothetical protein